MVGQTIILVGQPQRNLAEKIVRSAAPGAVVTVKPPGRTKSQSDKMWAMLTEVSRQKPEGRMHTPDVWKGLVMQACGHEVQWIEGLSGDPFPVGYRSKNLSKREMIDLIDWIYAYGAEHGVKFSY